jgi:type I restriction enzyme M protein
MSSQASSAGHGEKEVRKKIVETGDVDVIISIRSNFFYTRSVPCELWFFDRARSAERQDKVLMLDARQVYRKVTRKIYDFSPEQMKNLSAIVWLYRGQQHRFLALVRDYLGAVCAEGAAIPAKLTAFEKTLTDLRGHFSGLIQSVDMDGTLDADKTKALVEAAAELADAEKPYETDCARLLADLDSFRTQYTMATTLPPGEEPGLWETNQGLHAARRKFDPIAEALRGLIKQVDLLYKLIARMADVGSELAVAESVADVYDRRAAGRLVKQLDEERKTAVEQLKRVAYFHRQVVWLQERFPRAELEAVPGLVKLVDNQEIEAADWSLTPGRYVGVAPLEEDEDFDFEATLRDIHTELADLNQEAVELAAKIQANFEELGI